MSRGAAVQGFINWAEKHPEDWDKPMLSGVMSALQGRLRNDPQAVRPNGTCDEIHKAAVILTDSSHASKRSGL